jgi:hypothetical protein
MNDHDPEIMYVPVMSSQDPFHLLSALCPHAVKQTYNKKDGVEILNMVNK